MKSVERIRSVLIGTLGHALQRTRYLVATVEGGNDIIERLKGESGDRVLAQLVDCALLELGHVTATDTLHPNSATARAVRSGTIRQVDRAVNNRREVLNAK